MKPNLIACSLGPTSNSSALGEEKLLSVLGMLSLGESYLPILSSDAQWYEGCDRQSLSTLQARVVREPCRSVARQLFSTAASGLWGLFCPIIRRV